MTRRAALILLLGTACGCGPSFILLEIDAPLEIPAAANSLQIVTLDAESLTEILADVDLLLEAGDSFPLEVLLEPSDDTPRRVRQRATARLDGTPVAANEVEHGWDPGRTNVAKFELLLVPP